MQKHSTPPTTYTHSAASAEYRLGTRVWSYDPDDAQSRHAAHAAAAEALRELNAGRDPLLERLRARKAAYAEMKALAAIHSAHAPVDADGNVNLSFLNLTRAEEATR